MNISKYLNKYPSLKNKIILITGATSGLGLALVSLILQKEGNVILAIRNISKGEKIIKSLKSQYPSNNISLLELDQSDGKSIYNFADNLKNKFEHIDYFIFNAGVYTSKEDYKTKDGYELTFGTNYLGVYFLYFALEDYFNKNKTRLIFVTSLTGYYAKKISIDKANNLSRKYMYGYSKYCLDRLFYEISLKNNFISYYLIHPGVTSTNIISSSQTGIKNKFSLLKHQLFTLFTHDVNKACLIYLEAIFASDDYKVYITPRGLFHVSGYPHKQVLPKYMKKEGIIEETKLYLKETNNARSK
jgi:NAD(P)-dependent dehydrogenase (short-subunit alcohol dehydrogenase family)